MNSCLNCFFAGPVFGGGQVCLKNHAPVRDDFCCALHRLREANADLPVAPLIEYTPEPEAVEAAQISEQPAEAVTVEERLYPVRHHRQRFNFKSWLKDLLHINRLGTVNPARNFPHLFRRGETNELNINERSET